MKESSIWTFKKKTWGLLDFGFQPTEKYQVPKFRNAIRPQHTETFNRENSPLASIMGSQIYCLVKSTEVVHLNEKHQTRVIPKIGPCAGVTLDPSCLWASLSWINLPFQNSPRVSSSGLGLKYFVEGKNAGDYNIPYG